MSRRPLCSAWIYLLSLIAVAAVPAESIAAPALVSAVSRKSHGGTNFDVPLPLTGNPGIECRNVAPSLTIVLAFDANVVSGTAAITQGTATISGSPTFAGKTMTVVLTGVANAQRVTLTASNVSDGSTTLASVAVPFRVLTGDVNASGSVTATDTTVCKSNTGETANGANFRSDVDFSGTIGTTDTTTIKAKIGTAVAGGTAQNTKATITNIIDQSMAVNATGAPASLPINFTVGDAESDPAALYASAASNNTDIVKPAGLVLSGSGANRTLTVTPEVDATGTTLITVAVNDGLGTTVDTFILTVGQPNKLYLAQLRPAAGVTNCNASGQASLVLNGAKTQATVRVSYNNLTSAKTSLTIRHQATGTVLFDVDAATQQPDGTYLWTLAPINGFTAEQIVAALEANQTQVHIATALNTSGELVAPLNFVTGSVSFVVPSAPPALPGGTPTDADACRWLMQATFGPRPDDIAGSIDTIAAVKTLGFDEWFDRHTNSANANYVGTQTSLYTLLTNRTADATLKYPLGGAQVSEGWWNLALVGPDQLRQRVALAYSEIFVVSRTEDAIDAQPAGLASYHDMLARNAFTNFRTLLKDVTLHPVMGQYLNMRGSRKQASPTAAKPNENYAREIKQLFSIGLYELHPDGTLKLDRYGMPIDTYDQFRIEEFAKVFTGWLEDSVPVTYQAWDSTANALVTAKSYYTKPMVLRTGGNDAGYTPSAGNHDFANSKQLLNNYVIPATATTTVAQANLELDQALDNICNHPNVGPFICRRLIQRLVTSTPSPGYVYRVAQVFNNNGQGVRGDMKAVIKAILKDYEARTTDLLGNQGYGRIKEPILRLTQTIRALHPLSNNPTQTTPLPPYWRLPDMTNDLEQTPYRAPTVFNFFEPDFNSNINFNNPNNIAQKYVYPINAPEMQITTENSAVYLPKIMKKGIIDNTGFIPSSGGSSDVRIDIATEIGKAATSVDTLLDHLNRQLMAGQMSTPMRTLIKNYVSTVNGSSSADTNSRRARIATYLIVTSPQFCTQK